MSELHIPVVKGKSSVTIDTEAIDDVYYESALFQGLKVLVNGGATKIVKPSVETPEAMAEYHEAAIAKAQERVLGMLKGADKPLKLTSRGAKSDTGPGAKVMTEARRIAKALVKDMMKAAGIKQSGVSASEITRAANAVIESDPSIIKMAEDNLANRAAPPKGIDISTLGIKEDPKLVAKAKAKKAEAVPAGVLSKTQAGKVAPRAHTSH